MAGPLARQDPARAYLLAAAAESATRLHAFGVIAVYDRESLAVCLGFR
ncbi:MAG TPA: hypothetical protein VHJ82_04255 [Actinomycetota bacterium]|nr:hypothetical protein [Actinomycetota bacterium]